jgi:hypothetical protein
MNDSVVRAGIGFEKVGSAAAIFLLSERQENRNLRAASQITELFEKTIWIPTS